MQPPSMSPAPHSSTPRIGVFDSGLGGLSVLRAIRQHLPQADLLYVADSGHAPYGERGEAYVCERSKAIADFLLTQDVQVLVIACNTATAAAAAVLRQQHPDLAIVGVEPGIKPAAALTRNGHVGVLATEGTLRSEKFRLLAQAHAADVTLHLQACPGLAQAIEEGDLDSAVVRERVDSCCAPLRDQGVDTVVLGCTHYPFVGHHIQTALGPEVRLIDTADAVARRTSALCPSTPDSDSAHETPTVHLWTTGSVETLRHVTACWLHWACEVQPLSGS